MQTIQLPGVIGMLSKKYILLIMAFTLILISMSSVCASGPNNNMYPQNEINSEVNVDTGTFNELYKDIQNLQPGDTYNLDKDYVFDNENKTFYDNEKYSSNFHIITIKADNVTINGNGHTIDAGRMNFCAMSDRDNPDDFSMNTATIFKIAGNNVKILNLTFINSQPTNIHDIYATGSSSSLYNIGRGSNVISTCHGKYLPSPVCWFGDNGTISECTFSQNNASSGGAITWIGNNGHINNVRFINNTATILGGAIYVIGSNNSIANCSFTTSRGLISENIYYDRNSRNNKLYNITTDSNIPYIEGNISNLDVKQLENYYAVPFAGKYYDLIYLWYMSITTGFMIGVNNPDGTKYEIHSHYNNNTDVFSTVFSYSFSNNDCLYTITYTKICNDGDFNNLFCFDNPLHSEISIIINQIVNNMQDYENIVKCSYNNFHEKYLKDITHYDTHADSSCKVLNVTFKKDLNIDSKLALNPSGFDIIRIEGNNAKIDAYARCTEEYHWITMDSNTMLIVNNLEITGFNCAIENYGGYCELNNVILSSNQVNYLIERDWGGAIRNTGFLICNNCEFSFNFAKYGGAIFSQGTLIINNCNFECNKAYGEGEDIAIGLNGNVTLDTVNITSNKGPVTFLGGLSFDDVDTITAIAVGGSFVVGAIIGFCIGNPAAGAIVGGIVGAAIGATVATVINSYTYDLNHNRLMTYLTLIGGCAVAGALGGWLGGSLRVWIKELTYNPSASWTKVEASANTMEEKIEGLNVNAL